MTDTGELDATNPLTKLLQITLQIKDYAFPAEVRTKYKIGDQHMALGPCVSASLGRPMPEGGFALVDMLEDYIEMTKVCSEAIAYIKRNSPSKALESNLTNVRKIANLYASANISEPAHRINAFSPEILTLMQAVDDNISDREIQCEIPDDEIDILAAKINELIDVVRKSSFNDEAKDRLIKTSFAILDGVTRINYIGPEKMVKNIEVLLGQNIKAWADSNNDERKKVSFMELFRNTLEIVDGSQKMIEAMKTTFPVMMVLFSAVQHLVLGRSSQGE